MYMYLTETFLNIDCVFKYLLERPRNADLAS